MAALAVYTGFQQGVFVFAIGNKIGVAIVAAHALYLYHPLKSCTGAFFKTGCEVPPVLLGVESDGRLEQITIHIEDMRISMLAGANYIINTLYAFVHRVFAFEPKFHDIERIVDPVRFIKIVECGIVNECMGR